MRNKDTLNLLGLIILWLCITNAQAQNKIYPMAFGDGTYEVYVKDASTYTTNEDIVFVGNSTKLSEDGEGFVTRINNMGVVQWSKFWSTSPTEVNYIQKVHTLEDITYAVAGTNIPNEPQKYYLLQFALDGTLMYSGRVGHQTAIDYVDIDLTGLHVLNSSHVFTVYRVSNGEYFSSKDISGGTEFLLSASPTWEWHNFQGVSMNTAGNYEIIGNTRSTVFATTVNSTTYQGTGKTIIGTNNIITENTYVWGLDYNLDDRQKSWTLVQHFNATPPALYICYVNFGNATVETYSYVFTAMFTRAEFLDIEYISNTAYYAAAMSPAGTGVIIKHTGADGQNDGSTIVVAIEGLVNTAAITVDFTGTYLRMIFSAPSGPDGFFSGSQAAIFATDADLNFDAYTYFEPTNVD
jgi:hypothetical protein